MSLIEARDGAFWRDGREHRILAGSAHYFRVPRELWRDRLERLRAMGLNTLDTYVAWNVHEQDEGVYRFDGWRDVEAWIALAGEVGLDVVVRPGPYICAEWSNGGLPVWLTARERALRSSAPGFLHPVDRWFDELLPRLAPLQASSGGPIVAWQLENEYGSFGDDQAYLHTLLDALRARGVDEFIYTADGATAAMTRRGSVDGILAAYTFGTNPQVADALRTARGDGALLCAEFWGGWFDHWGESHHVRSAESATTAVGELLALGGSVSVYMAHGGTNHGLWAGANHDGTRIQPTVTSYDSDAPVGEDGTLGEKFDAYRALFAPFQSTPLPPVPAQPVRQSAARWVLRDAVALLPALDARSEPVVSPLPKTFEELGLAEGLVVYATRVELDGATLHIDDLRDRASVFVNGVLVGTLDRDGATSLELGDLGEVLLEIVVETKGRINYGHRLGEHKGIVGGVRLERALVHGWASRAVALDRWTDDDLQIALAVPAPSNRSGFSRAVATLGEVADAWLEVEGGGKGVVWVNGALLGRFWSEGPQGTLYAPAPLWRTGDNEIVVMDLEGRPAAIRVHETPLLGPSEEFVEQL